MKKTILLFAMAAITVLSCTKTTTNNYGFSQPPFIINGLTDVIFRNTSIVNAGLSLSIQYTDSSQEAITLSLSPLPAGITMDTNWTTNGTPSFTTYLTFYDTTSAGATPGTYPITLTATSASTKKSFTFNIKVLPAIPCTSYMLGKYTNCYSYCSSTGGTYLDSVYADPTVVNKIWFTNFNNSGNTVYGIYNCGSEELTIPSQTVGSVTYQGTGYSYYTTGSRFISVSLSSPSSCSFTDQ